jgi:nitrous oxide reductase
VRFFTSLRSVQNLKTTKEKHTMKQIMLIAVVAAMLIGCGGEKKGRGGGGTEARSDVQQAALATYVAPGDLDEYYIFKSGGHSGQIYVYGVPSMRHISTIPVFTPYPATGYGFDKESKEMLGGYTWGDVHHPANSETNGDYDGRWLFANDNANNRMARINSRTDSKRVGQSRLDVRDGKYRIHSVGVALLNSDSERNGGED